MYLIDTIYNIKFTYCNSFLIRVNTFYILQTN